jgi:hypothetical protein
LEEIKMQKTKHSVKRDGMPISSILPLVSRSTKPAIERFIASNPIVCVKVADCSPEKTVLAFYSWNNGVWEVMDIRSRGSYPNQTDLFSYYSVKELQATFKRKPNEDPYSKLNVYLKVIK